MLPGPASSDHLSVAGLTYTWLQHKNADRTVLNLDGFSSTSMSDDTTTVTDSDTSREESFMQFCLWCSMHSNDDVYPIGNKVIMGDFNGANVCDSSGRPRQHYPPPSFHSFLLLWT